MLSGSDELKLTLTSGREIANWPAHCVPAALEEHIHLLVRRVFSHRSLYMERKKNGCLATLIFQILTSCGSIA